MHKLATFVLFLSLATCTLATIQCWQGMETVARGKKSEPDTGNPFITVQCNDADFCYEKWVTRHKNGDSSYTVTKACGETGKCYQSGCTGPFDEKICCCADNLCNSSNGLNLSLAGIILILTVPLRNLF